MSERILVVDASPLIYSVFSTQGHLATSEGVSTGLRYGFLRSINSYKNRTKADKVVLCFDRRGPIKKAEGVESYKSNRDFTEEKATMYSQVPDLREMISLTSWIQVDAEGYEADDCIAALVRAKAPRGNVVIVISPDNDMAQLVAEGARIFVPKKGDVKKDYYKTANDVEQIFGVPSKHILVWRAIEGDKSDNLPGINITPAMKERIKELMWQKPDLTLDPEMFAINVLKECDSEVREHFRSNYKVMSLVTPPNLNVQKGKADATALLSLFEELEFKSMYSKVEEFVK